MTSDLRLTVNVANASEHSDHVSDSSWFILWLVQS